MPKIAPRFELVLSTGGLGAIALLPLLVLACGSSGDTPQPTLSVEQLMDPQTCSECHAQHYAEWSGSMHAYASQDPLFVALNQRAQDAGNVGSLCATCHAPMAVRTGATKDGTDLASLPARLQGVTCYACHNVQEITNTHNNSLRLGNDSTMRGAIESPIASSAHGSAYSSLHDRSQLVSATLCGSCHDVVNGHGVAVERSFAEWQASAFAAAAGSTCGQCHMSKGVERAPIASVSGAPPRDRHGHQFPGVDLALTAFPEQDEQRRLVQSFLDSTLQTALCVRGRGDNSSLVVVVDNVASGHKWPSGAAQDRRAWFEVAAFSGAAETYRSGAVAEGSDPNPLTDPDLWLVSDCLLDQDGNAVSKLWDARSVDSNLLPGQLTFDRSAPEFYQSHVTRTFPKNPLASLKSFPSRATLDVHLLPFPYALFDDLFSDPARLGMDAAGVAAVRERLRTLDLGEQLVWTAEAAADTAHGGLTYIDQGVPMSCVSTTGMVASADKVAAPEHSALGCSVPQTVR
jgi:Cytochrome c554 and c-prime